jgi:hypothetical protein
VIQKFIKFQIVKKTDSIIFLFVRRNYDQDRLFIDRSKINDRNRNFKIRAKKNILLTHRF